MRNFATAAVEQCSVGVAIAKLGKARKWILMKALVDWKRRWIESDARIGTGRAQPSCQFCRDILITSQIEYAVRIDAWHEVDTLIFATDPTKSFLRLFGESSPSRQEDERNNPAPHVPGRHELPEAFVR